MNNPLQRKHKPHLQEIHRYVADIETITSLRNIAEQQGRTEELLNYNRTIQTMQLVLIYLNDGKVE